MRVAALLRKTAPGVCQMNCKRGIDRGIVVSAGTSIALRSISGGHEVPRGVYIHIPQGGPHDDCGCRGYPEKLCMDRFRREL